MFRQGFRRLFRWGIAGVLLASLVFNPGPVNENVSAAPAPFYAMSVSGPIEVCSKPEQLYLVRVVVTATSGKRTRRLPGIGIIAEVGPGAGIQPTAAITGGPLSIAQFSIQPAGGQGTATVTFKAVGSDPVTHQLVNVTSPFSVNIITCTYKLTIHGHLDVFHNYMDEIALGDGTATINNDNTLTGSGKIWMEQAWNLPVPTVKCDNISVQKTFQFAIGGSVSSGTNVHFELTFSGDPIPILSTQAMCDTGNHSTIGQKIPFWPVTPKYLGIDTFDIDPQGGVLDGPYPMKGDYSDLSVIVDLVNPLSPAP